MRVQVFECAYYLHRVALHFELVQALPPFDQVIQRLVLANLQQNVHVLCVLKKVLELANVEVPQAAMDLNLRH